MNINKEVQKDVQILIKFIHKLVNTLTWSQYTPHSKEALIMKKGWVTLKGELSCPYQREATTLLVNNLASVEELPRLVILKAKAQPELTTEMSEQVFLGRWAVDNRGIQVDLTGTRVTLRGLVDSLSQKEEAERMAWNAPGVLRVDNDLSISRML